MYCACHFLTKMKNKQDGMLPSFFCVSFMRSFEAVLLSSPILFESLYCGMALDGGNFETCPQSFGCWIASTSGSLHRLQRLILRSRKAILALQLEVLYLHPIGASMRKVGDQWLSHLKISSSVVKAIHRSSDVFVRKSCSHDMCF